MCGLFKDALNNSLHSV